MISWTRDTVSFLVLTVSAAIWLVVHLALSLRAARNRGLHRWLRALAWLPPLTPVAGYLTGARARALLWCIMAVAYLVLRSQV